MLTTHRSPYIYICHTEFNIMQAYERCRMGWLKINLEIVRTQVFKSCTGHDISP